MTKTPYPAIVSSEIDNTIKVTSESSAIGAMVGRFQKGPVDVPTLVENTTELLEIFGEPKRDGVNFDNLEDWYNATDFFKYSSGLYVTRVEAATSYNAGINFDDTASALASTIQVKDGYDMSGATIADTGLNFISKYPGTYGNDLSVSLVLESDLDFGLTTNWDGYYYDNKVVLTLAGALTGLTVGEYVVTEEGATGLVALVATADVTVLYNDTAFVTGTNNIHEGQVWDSGAATKQSISSIGTPTVYNFNTFMADFEETLETGDVAYKVYLDDINGDPQLVERSIVSLTTGTKDYNNKAKYVDDYTERYSRYISARYNSSGAALTSYGVANALTAGALAAQSSITAALIVTAMDNYYADPELSFDFIMDGGWAGDTTVMNKVISIGEARLDCFGVTSCGTSVAVTSQAAFIAALKAKRELLTDSTRSRFVGMYKTEEIDTYSGRTFDCGLSGEVMGMMANVRANNDPWTPASGYNSGAFLNIGKLPIHVSKSNLGVLHTKQIDLVINDKKIGGFYLLSQLTLTGRPSAFADINVRQLFTYCELNITNSLKVFLWKFNDVETRSIVTAITNNFLNTVQSGRGLTDFNVICDETNNTADIIDSNQLICDVFIKPNRAIYYIKLRFVASRTDASFDELSS